MVTCEEEAADWVGPLAGVLEMTWVIFMCGYTDVMNHRAVHSRFQ